MQPFARFWARHRELVETEQGPYDLQLWGWSHHSMADALEVARRRVADFRARGGRLDDDQYYPLTPLREETLHEVYADDGRLLAVITRNRMGVEVLNTDLLLIADVDVVEDRPRRRLLGLLPARAPEGPSPEDRARQAIDTFARANPTLGVQVYRTAAGFRVFVTGADAAPDSAAAQSILTALDSDRLYAHLCRAHQSCRARLTPKPWRIPWHSLSQDWPHQTPEQEQRAGAWVLGYEQQHPAYATCRREAAYGPAPTPDEARVLALHDARTRTLDDLPLA